jgi:hypothetical protein
MKTFNIITRVYGIAIASLIILVFIPHLIGDINNKGLEGIKLAINALFNWYNNPTGLFTTFIVGYITVWKNQLIGALIIISASVLATLINLDNPGWPIFTAPTMVVGIMYSFNSKLYQIKRKA